MTLDISTTPVARQLDQVVTAVTGRADRVVDAPAGVTIVTREAVATRPSLTVVDHIKSVPGIDVSTGGIVQSNVVSRGFNNAFSGTLLTLQDYRFATVPSLRVNVPFLFTSINEDIQRVEVVLGPAAALYGPNSSSGVLHIVTRSPFESEGSTITFDGGSRSIARGSLRNAGVINPKLAYKVSGEYMTGDDFHYFDPGEGAAVKHAGTPIVRDFATSRYAGEARVDVRPREGMEFVTTYGITRVANSLELTGANGAAQVKNWTYQSVQERFTWNNLFAQVFLNSSDAGNRDTLDSRGTFLLRTGQPIVDQSRVAAGSVQHAFDMAAGRQRFVYGADYTWTNPRTGGTIDGLNEDDDNVTEHGVYLHSLTRLSPMWEVTAALRADNNNRLHGTFFSPRAALVFKPTESQNFRFTFNRAYSTPANYSMFLDLIQARNAGGLPYDVRAMGVPPANGWDYRRTCNAQLAGGYCMRSPFTSALGAPNTYVDANAAAYYQTALAIVRPQLPASVAGLIPILNALNPTSAQVAPVLRWLVGPTNPVDPASLTHIDPLKASFVNNFELGYKGLVGDRTRLSLDGWTQKRMNFITAAQISTPSVFLEPTSLGAYLGAQITAALMAQGMPQAQAQATAAAAAPAIAAGLAKVPVGTVTFDDPKLANRPDVMFTYRNVDKAISLWGIDVGIDHSLTERFSVEGTYSYVNKESFPDIDGGGGQPLRLNAPKNKGTLTGHFNDDRRGIRAELRARYADGFAVNSGVYTSGVYFSRPGVLCNQAAPTDAACYQYDAVPSSTVWDAGFSVRVRKLGEGASIAVNATNLLNDPTPTFVGVPAMGRMIMTRLQYSF
jgi:iron complex outermembrane receptor protein